MNSIKSIKHTAFIDELEKIALSGKTLTSFARKAAIKGNRYDMARHTVEGMSGRQNASIGSMMLGDSRSMINDAVKSSRKSMSNKPIRNEAIDQAVGLRAKKIIFKRAVER